MKHLVSLRGGLLLACLLTQSCESGPNSIIAPEDQHLAYRQGDHGFVGTVDGTEAFIAIVTGLEVAEVLVVHGGDEIYEWFEVDLLDDYALSFENAVGAGISAVYENDTFAGEVTLRNGQKHSFATNVIEGDVAGMFFILDEQCDRGEAEGGWIIDGAGTQRGAMLIQSQFVDTPGTRLQYREPRWHRFSRLQSKATLPQQGLRWWAINGVPRRVQNSRSGGAGEHPLSGVIDSWLLSRMLPGAPGRLEFLSSTHRDFTDPVSPSVGHLERHTQIAIGRCAIFIDEPVLVALVQPDFDKSAEALIQ